MPIETPSRDPELKDKPFDGVLASLETINGSIQVSAGGKPGQLGLLIERDQASCGLLLSEEQARFLADLLISASKTRREDGPGKIWRDNLVGLRQAANLGLQQGLDSVAQFPQNVGYCSKP